MRMITTFDYKYCQNALRHAIVFSIFAFCEESLVRDTNLHYKVATKCILVIVVR